jgi:signal transduction histidine kinase
VNTTRTGTLSDRPLRTALGWRLPGWLLDVGPVALIVVISVGATAIHAANRRRAVEFGLAILIVATALLVRHRAPLVVLAVVIAVMLGVNYSPIVMLPLLLAVFTVAEYLDRTTLIVAAAVAAVAAVVTPALHGVTESPPAIISRLVAVGLAVAVGLYLRARADYVLGLHERAERLERERELLAHQAVADERVRIARELHDVVAHNVSLMVVQAQALAATTARKGYGVTHADDDERVQALDRLATLGREALSEMHRMLGVLRIQNGGAPEREPQPGVRDLEKLIEHARETGIEALLNVEGEPRDLPPGVDLSAYRIVQEALTNVINHAHAQQARVTLNYAPATLEVTVTDDGAASVDTARTYNGGGHGLIGMRERVALFGGTLDAAPRLDGPGYRVHAVLPVD